MVTAVVEALGIIPKRLAFYMTLLNSLSVEMIQKPAILAKAWILRKVLEMEIMSGLSRL